MTATEARSIMSDMNAAWGQKIPTDSKLVWIRFIDDLDYDVTRDVADWTIKSARYRPSIADFRADVKAEIKRRREAEKAKERAKESEKTLTSEEREEIRQMMADWADKSKF